MKFSIFGDYCYFDCYEEVIAWDAWGLREALVRLEEYKENFYCVGFISYEAHRAFALLDRARQESQEIDKENQNFSSLPFLYFGIFSQREAFKPKPSKNIFHPLKQKIITPHHYKQKIQALKEQIAMGNTYQGNFTTFFEFESTLPSFAIFEALLGKQDTAYKAFLPTPFGDILSFSPELFFRIEKDWILSKPMKGTMPRGRNEIEDEANKQFLASDIKNRSENVMIVDLLRNDLSKIVQNGSLSVSKLFEVETYPSLFQMTSTIEGRLEAHSNLFEIFQALFPCGSITGAPKEITTEILHSLEERERGVYCGAIGVFDREEAVFSIPIRTIFREKSEGDSHSVCPHIKKSKMSQELGKCHYGVGSGIVWDSEADLEYEELQTKMKFLKQDFCLLETMLYTPTDIHQEFLTLPQGLSFLSLHLERLQRSAEDLGFVYPQDLQERLMAFKWDEKKIIRLILSPNGEVSFEILPFVEIASRKIDLQEKPFWSDLESYKITFCDSFDDGKQFLQNTHLTPHYKDLKGLNLFDCLYHRDGILLEGMRSNLVLELGGEFLTPSDGILKGVCREVLLQNGVVKEATLRVEDLKKAERIFCINSVRGMLQVHLL